MSWLICPSVRLERVFQFNLYTIPTAHTKGISQTLPEAISDIEENKMKTHHYIGKYFIFSVEKELKNPDMDSHREKSIQ